MIHRSLRAAVEGSYFPDWELQALTAFDRADLAQVLADWPEATLAMPWESDPVRVQKLAVSAVLNNLLGYPHGQWDVLRSVLGVGPDELREILERWRGVPEQPPA